MLESRPASTLGSIVGFSILVGLAALDLGLVLLLFRSPVTLLSFLWGALLVTSLPIGGLVVYWAIVLPQTRYHVAGNMLVIHWGGIQQAIPLSQIHTVVMGQTLGMGRFRGLRWPGFWLGKARVYDRESETGYEALFYATTPLYRQLLLVTNNIAYAVSPTDLENFRDCLVALRGANLGSDPETVTSNWSIWSWQVWYDRMAHRVWGTAVFLNALLFAYLCTLFGRLPVSVPLHFNAQGVVDRMGTPANLFVLPLAGLLTWFVNGALGLLFYEWHNERLVAFICWGTAVLIQFAAWGALLGLLY